MQTTYEFRVNADYVDRLFQPNEGRNQGAARIIHIGIDDPKFPRIGDLSREIDRETNGRDYFFAGWNIRYRYSKQELAIAEAFKLWPTQTIQPAGEECGTVYDESTACPDCGAGRKQVSGLRLDLRNAPKSNDIARTIAGEIIISQRFAELLIDGGFSGFELCPVRHKVRFEDDPIDLLATASGSELLRSAEAAGSPYNTGNFWVWLNRSENQKLFKQCLGEYTAVSGQSTERARETFPKWYQLIATVSVGIAVPTRVGIDPFDEDPKRKHRCPRGDTIGLNLLSELWVSRRDFVQTNCDVHCTKQCLGIHRGLIRPEPTLVISPRLWKTIDEKQIRGIRLEVAHIGDGNVM